MVILNYITYRTFIPAVPRQKAKSNDCGLFMLKFVKKIVSNPTEFILKGKTDGLKRWFNVRSQITRKILSEQIVAKGRSQRESGEIKSKFPNLPYLA